jgi:D-glycero-alpha-D-manno-heptose-7-phosphate kinase
VGSELVANTHLYYTGHRRDAADVLAVQDRAMSERATDTDRAVEENLNTIKAIGRRVLEAITKEDFDEWGRLLHEHWLQKRMMSSSISLPVVEELYDTVRRRFGVLGGKLVGAGGGGFLLLYANARHKELERFMAEQGMMRLHYALEPEGSKIVAAL